MRTAACVLLLTMTFIKQKNSRVEVCGLLLHILRCFFFFLPSNFIDSVPRAQRRIQSISKHNDTFQILSIYCCKDKAGFQHQPQCMALSLCNLWAFADTSSKGLTSHRSFRLHGPPGLSVEFFQKFDNRKADLILKFPEMKQP